MVAPEFALRECLMLKLSAFLLAACAALPVHADWQLDNESSRLSFISTKATHITEVNRFRGLRGSVEDDGKVRLQVELETVETGIPLRDERVRKQLFEIARFAEAEISAQLDFAPLVALAPGAQLELRLPLLVNLHGHKQEYRSELLVTRLDDRRFQVVTLAPLVLNAADFGLAEGLESLRALAGLPAISLAVPVSAVLIFNAR
jgi:hypothetical protein